MGIQRDLLPPIGNYNDFVRRSVAVCQLSKDVASSYGYKGNHVAESF